MGRVQGGEEDKPTTTAMTIFSGPATCQSLAGLILLHSHNSHPIGPPCLGQVIVYMSFGDFFFFFCYHDKR